MNLEKNLENLSFDQLPKAVAILLDEVKGLKNLITNQTANAEPSTPKDELMNVEQTAEFLNLSVPTIYGKVHRRELPVMKQGNRLYFSKFELLDYLKKGRQQTIQEIEDEAGSYLLNHKKTAEL